ncbi:MAG: hypothetical protein VYD05_13365, partial [Planctomycetota bacterium]|nr:hypothetical protein [Planctomycetota bacterium]
MITEESTSEKKQLNPSNQGKGVLGSHCRGEQTSCLAKSAGPQPDLTKNEFGSAQEGGLELGGSCIPTNHAVEQVGEAAIARRGQELLEDTKQQRLEMHLVLSPLRQVLRLSRSTREGRRLELEVGDITWGVEMRRQTSPVEESTERNKDDVVQTGKDGGALSAADG